MASEAIMQTSNADRNNRYLQEGILKAQSLVSSEFNPLATDTIICSFPKSGYTWLKSLAFTVVTRARFDLLKPKGHPIHSSLSHKLIPALELEVAQERVPRDPELPLFSTHLSYEQLPKPVLESECKIVYICRNPKDVFVSFWHFLSKRCPNTNEVERPLIPLEGLFHKFCAGKLTYGSYWDNVLGYWKASLDHPHRILFLKYEDMMKDPESNLKRLAEFMDCPFSDEEERKGVPMKIVEMCSFESLSNLEVNKTANYRWYSNDAFFRKAKVGDWVNYLTLDMANELDQITHQKFGNSGLNI